MLHYCKLGDSFSYRSEEEQSMTFEIQKRVPITVEAFKSIRAIGDMHLSADGKRVAFEVQECPPGQSKGRTRIWALETSGGQAELLTHGKEGDLCPRWSPDGTQLAFLSKSGGEKSPLQLYLMDAIGGDARQVCTLPNGVITLEWSPDGSKIAFLSLEGAEPGSDPKVFLPAQEQHRRLWTIRVDDDIPVAVTPEGSTVWEYAWSPDGQHFALYYSTRPGNTGWYHSQIGVVSAAGGAVRQLTHFSPVSVQARAIAWSPDSQQLAYLVGKWSDPGRGAGDIFLLSLQDGQSRNLTPGIACSPTWCAWFPDGHRLLYTAVDRVSHQIGILETSDGTITVLDTSFVMTRDQPRLSPTPDLTSFVTVHSTSQQLAEVYRGTLTDGVTSVEWQRLTRLNPLAEETWLFAPSQPVSYASVDGHLVHALFTPPINATGDALPPLFVDVHGGPSGASCDVWARYPQLLPSAGYAVLRVNYRGSWGNGAAFADAVMGDVGGKDLQDILFGIDYLIDQGLVDGNRLAIGGWSNGGFLSAWAVTQTTRFKAAMMGAGISDWFNMHAQTNIPDADLLMLTVDLLEQPEVYYQHSPMTFASRVKTPTLILHGENDPCVPVAQAYAFYRALSERNVPVEMAIYPREGHGLGEWDHIIDSDHRLLRWLEQYV
jgi:dipeptidyl aminopeptidase/acylaminoacyl peptidase